MKVSLVTQLPCIVKPQGNKKQVLLKEGTNVIGRESKSSDITLTFGNFTSHISRKHCQIIKSGTSLVIEDLNSTFGTDVNEQEIHVPTELHIGDKIGLGRKHSTGAIEFTVE